MSNRREENVSGLDDRFKEVISEFTLPQNRMDIPDKYYSETKDS